MNAQQAAALGISTMCGKTQILLAIYPAFGLGYVMRSPTDLGSMKYAPRLGLNINICEQYFFFFLF